MGNICSCCVAEDENKEYAPVETQEVAIKPKAQDKAVPNYLAIVDQASSLFLSSKPKRSESSSAYGPESVESFRTKIESAAIDASLTKSPLFGYPTRNSDSLAQELSHPAKRPATSTLQAGDRIVELVSKPHFPQDCYPIDGFTQDGDAESR